MSLSAISPSSLLDSSLFTSLVKGTARPNGGSAATPASASPDPVTGDLVSLLKALSSGDTAASRADLTRLKADLNTSHARLQSKATDADGDADGVSSTSSLDSLLSTLSASLNSGNTAAALTSLAGYLAQSGQGTGMLLNTKM